MTQFVARRAARKRLSTGSPGPAQSLLALTGAGPEAGRMLSALERWLLLVRTYLQFLPVEAEQDFLTLLQEEGQALVAALPELKAALARLPEPERQALWSGVTEAGAVTRPAQGAEGASPGLSELTRRELATLELLIEGLTNRQISDRLCVSPNTVKTHLQSAYGKLGVSSRTQAVRCLKHLGICD